MAKQISEMETNMSKTRITPSKLTFLLNELGDISLHKADEF